MREPTGFSGYPTFEGPLNFYTLYKHVIAAGMQFLRRIEWLWSANVAGALLWEPKAAIQTGTDLKAGEREDFHPFGMNPTELLPWHKTPILALHGKNGNQGMFLKMGEFFQQNEIGPVFTVNLPGGELTPLSRAIIDQKILEIQALYGYRVQVDLLGYSMGAETALYAALPENAFTIDNGYCYQTQPWETWRPDVGRIIRIGSMTTEEEWNALSEEMRSSIWEIRGLDDIHMPEPSFAENQYEVEGVGHVGLIFSEAVFEYIKSLEVSA